MIYANILDLYRQYVTAIILTYMTPGSCVILTSPALGLTMVVAYGMVVSIELS